MKKKYSVITVAVFLALIVFFTSFSVFGKKSDFSEKENRALQMYPDVSLDSIGDGTFQEEYDAFLSDQFEFRDFWVKARTELLKKLGRKDINGVYYGKDGYLIEKYTERDFKSDDVENNVSCLTEFLNRNAEKGYSVSVAFVPSKAGVLKNKMPSGAAPYDTSVIAEEVYSGASDRVNKIDLYLPLTSHNNEYIYYKTDHHWTSLGAYYAYREIADKMALDAVDISAFESVTVSDSFLGSTYDKVQYKTEPDSITRYDSRVKVTVDYGNDRAASDSLYDESFLSQKSKYDYFLGGNFARVDINTDVKNGKTLLLIKDSYANSVLPFLVNNFEHIIMLDLRFITDDVQEIIDSEKPDELLVLYNVEKFMGDENQYKLEEGAETGEDASDEAASEETGDSAEDEAILKELEEEEAREGTED